MLHAMPNPPENTSAVISPPDDHTSRQQINQCDSQVCTIQHQQSRRPLRAIMCQQLTDYNGTHGLRHR